jgi:transposase-like protein
MANHKYSAELKKKIAIEAIKEQRTINQIAQEYKVHPVQVSTWKKQLLDGCITVFESSSPSKQNDREEELAMLERKVGRLSVENDFLKKKLGH